MKEKRKKEIDLLLSKTAFLYKIQVHLFYLRITGFSLSLKNNNCSTKEKNVHNLTRSISVSSLRYHITNLSITHHIMHELRINQNRRS